MNQFNLMKSEFKAHFYEKYFINILKYIYLPATAEVLHQLILDVRDHQYKTQKNLYHIFYLSCIKLFEENTWNNIHASIIAFS